MLFSIFIFWLQILKLIFLFFQERKSKEKTFFGATGEITKMVKTSFKDFAGGFWLKIIVLFLTGKWVLRILFAV